MDWHLKAILQSVFSHLPSGHHVNYLFQRHVTRSFPIDENSFQDIVTWSEPHIDAIRRHHPLPLSRLQFYEFGAGYHLILPLTYYAFGVERQTIVDINQLIRPELINESIVKFRELDIALHLPRRPSRLVDERCLIPSLKALYGIEYRAPCDARATGLPEGSVDCITSTSTLEHISPTDIQAILRECHRILRPDGMMTAMVDYLDHYSFFDKNISGYNFLRYSDSAWKMFNPSLHFQNRLRHSDYVALFKSCGFRIIESRRREGSAADLEAVQQVSLDRKFARYELQDLIARGGFFTLSKADAELTEAPRA